MRTIAALVTLTFVLSLVPGALAHPAPPPLSYETRVLHDHSDDWGGHALTNDGHDLIALDLREEWNGGLGEHVLVFRFVMNGGYARLGSDAPDLTERLRFQIGSTPYEYALHTSDNQAFTGDFDRIAGPFPVLKEDGTQDGARFSVEGHVRYSSIDLNIGNVLSDFQIIGYAGDGEADHLPGGDLGDVGAEAAFAAASYELVGATKYLTATLDQTAVTLDAGADSGVDLGLSLSNIIEEDQNATITVNAPPGIEVDLGTPTFTLDKEANLDRTMAIQAAPTAQAGLLVVTITTDLGGRVQEVVTIDVNPAAQPADDGDTHEQHHDNDSGDGAHDDGDGTTDDNDPTHGTGDMHDDHETHGDGPTDGNGDASTTEESPSLALIPLAGLALVGIGLARRRRG